MKKWTVAAGKQASGWREGRSQCRTRDAVRVSEVVVEVGNGGLVVCALFVFVWVVERVREEGVLLARASIEALRDM